MGDLKTEKLLLCSQSTNKKYENTKPNSDMHFHFNRYYSMFIRFSGRSIYLVYRKDVWNLNSFLNAAEGDS